MKRDKTVVKHRVLNALSRLYERDAELLDIWAHERSVTHKLAEHLQQEFPEWNVDCEYNRVNDEPKRLRMLRNSIDSDNLNGQTVFPDIIVHIRGEIKNLLIIEVKKRNPSGKLKVDEHDEKKLKLFTKLKEFQYHYALYILLDKEKPLHIFLYQKGKRTGENWAEDFQEHRKNLHNKQHIPSTWIFQTNPKNFRVDAYLQENLLIQWTVR